jgi:hypothetical protein
MTGPEVEIVRPISGTAVRPAYQVREVRMDQDLRTIMHSWKECNASFQDHTIVCDPEWLQERSKLEKADIRAYLFERDSRILGAVPLEVYHHRLDCQLGDRTVMKLPLNMVRLLGNTPNIPQDESAHSLFFESLLSLEFDAIYMTCIKADSFFWWYLQNSPFIKKHFYFYSVHQKAGTISPGSSENFVKRGTWNLSKSLGSRTSIRLWRQQSTFPERPTSFMCWASEFVILIG